ncbi:MAG: hypothetical protein ACLP1X_17370 [Polyangiaceae bacterium]
MGVPARTPFATTTAITIEITLPIADPGVDPFWRAPPGQFWRALKDVFACDRPSATWVSPVRRILGLCDPIVLGGHPRGRGGFVADLMAKWP